MKTYAPLPYQKPMNAHVLSVPRCALFAPMGSGKTVTTLTAVDALYCCGDITARTLVLGPKRVVVSTWPTEAKKWEHLSELEVVAAAGTARERLAALRSDAPVVCTNYDNLPWLIEQYKGKAWPFEMVVADESTRLKSFRLRQGGQRAQALATVAHKQVKRWLNLTGTPAPNGLKDLWGQTWFLDKGLRLGHSYDAFKSRWFKPDWSGFGIEPLPFAQEQIEERLRDICLTVDLSEYFDVAKPIVRTISVELPATAMKLYRQFEKEMFMELGEHEVEAFNAAAKSVKCLQLANGAAYLDGTDAEGQRNWHPVHDAKLEALDSLCNELAGAPLLVAYHFKSDLARLRKAFPKARVLDDKPQTIVEWNAGKIDMLLLHPASAGHGLNLQDGGCNIVFFGHWWDAEQYEQACERIGPLRQRQSGHPRPVTIYHIVARGTLDEAVVERRTTKCSVQQALLNAMKRRG